MRKMVLVLDCGATNVRAIVVDEKGTLVHAESRPNAAVRQAPGKDWLVWDTEGIWNKLLECARIAVRKAGAGNIAALTATSFSDDGAPVDRNGSLLYPVISWQCPRTVEISESIGKIIPLPLLYRITGEQVMRQHTLFRLLWLRAHAPAALEKAYKYLMFPGILNFRLTGEMVNDPTTADSMMLLDIRKRKYSPRLLAMVGLDEGFFGRMVEPGSIIGTLLPAAAKRMGLRPHLPVVASGHDTQFAVSGSGAGPGEWVLSSGTWEILFQRSRTCITGAAARKAGIKNECDAVPGLFNAGRQWIGSGALEWLIGLQRPHLIDKESVYRSLIAAAGKAAPGSGGVTVLPSFLPGSGVNREHRTAGTILGCTLGTTEAEIYRAFIEGLSFQLRQSVESIARFTGNHPSSLIVVGGGSKNTLWNRIRADVLGIPVRLTRQSENTVVGAALFGFIGAGVYRDHREALRGTRIAGETVEPSAQAKVYDELFARYKTLAPALGPYYRAAAIRR